MPHAHTAWSRRLPACGATVNSPRNPDNQGSGRIADRYAALVIANASLFDSLSPPDDPALRAVGDELLAHDPDGSRVARVLRRTYDMLLDGQHTGQVPLGSACTRPRRPISARWWRSTCSASSASPTGRRWISPSAGIDVDCKYSQGLADWMIPPEAVGQILLGLWASDDQGNGLWALFAPAINC